jgi:hypothetical protein
MTIERRLSALTWNYAQRNQPLDRKDRYIATVLAGIRNIHRRRPVPKETMLPQGIIATLETPDRDQFGRDPLEEIRRASRGVVVFGKNSSGPMQPRSEDG